MKWLDSLPSILHSLGPSLLLSTLMDVFLMLFKGASRIRYEQKFNPVWRHARKLMPFGILLSAVALVDMKTGILWSFINSQSINLPIHHFTHLFDLIPKANYHFEFSIIFMCDYFISYYLCIFIFMHLVVIFLKNMVFLYVLFSFL